MLVNTEIKQNATLKNTIRIKNKKRLKISLINRTVPRKQESLHLDKKNQIRLFHKSYFFYYNSYNCKLANDK